MKIIDLDRIIQRIAASKKYRSMDIPHETIHDLLEQELSHHEKEADAIKSARSKLHNIMAPYLGDLDYEAAAAELDEVLASGDKAKLAEACTQFLKVHHSTAERLDYVKEFYGYIFKILGADCSILDLACGLNPFMLPLVELPTSLTYTAFDIHTPRVELIKRLFSGGIGLQGNAETRDILVRPPQQKATAAFLFKEAHRMEKRRSGATRDLIASLNVKHVFLSLPTHSLNGRFDLHERMNRLVESSIQGLGLKLNVKEFVSETLFHLGKNHGEA
ncbi:MAG: hypothetical protein Q7J07_08920 [Pelolinea sp.]|nr:hypothetical protein [Pelolinea sp.]